MRGRVVGIELTSLASLGRKHTTSTLRSRKRFTSCGKHCGRHLRTQSGLSLTLDEHGNQLHKPSNAQHNQRNLKQPPKALQHICVTHPWAVLIVAIWVLVQLADQP
jgi:hypothetical protein